MFFFGRLAGSKRCAQFYSRLHALLIRVLAQVKDATDISLRSIRMVDEISADLQARAMQLVDDGRSLEVWLTVLTVHAAVAVTMSPSLLPFHLSAC